VSGTPSISTASSLPLISTGISGSVSSLSSPYSSSTTLGQISNIPIGTSVISSSTSSQVSNSQNQLIQNIPSSPNTVTYEVTSTAK
jgi:hypothetical protein